MGFVCGWTRDERGWTTVQMRKERIAPVRAVCARTGLFLFFGALVDDLSTVLPHRVAQDRPGPVLQFCYVETMC